MRFYSAEEVRAAIRPRELISELKRHLTIPHRNSPRSVIETPKGTAIGAMLSSSPELLGGKLVSVFPEATQSERNPHQGLVLLFSPVDGSVTAAFDASEITALRTAAMSALATKELSLSQTQELVIFGTGLQAELHASIISESRPIRSIRIVGRDPKKSLALASRLRKKLRIQCTPESWENPQLPQAPLIFCLCTAARHPYLEERQIPIGSHINAVGACRPGMNEIQIAPNGSMQIYVDDLDRIQEESSELQEVLRHRGGLPLIREVFSGKTPGRSHDNEITLFKSVGTGLQDIVAAELVRKTLERSIP